MDVLHRVLTGDLQQLAAAFHLLLKRGSSLDFPPSLSAAVHPLNQPCTVMGEASLLLLKIRQHCRKMHMYLCRLCFSLGIGSTTEGGPCMSEQDHTPHWTPPGLGKICIAPVEACAASSSLLFVFKQTCYCGQQTQCGRLLRVKALACSAISLPNKCCPSLSNCRPQDVLLFSAFPSYLCSLWQVAADGGEAASEPSVWPWSTNGGKGGEKSQCYNQSFE